jgi:hypothetical protein
MALNEFWAQRLAELKFCKWRNCDVGQEVGFIHSSCEARRKRMEPGDEQLQDEFKKH